MTTAEQRRAAALEALAQQAIEQPSRASADPGTRFQVDLQPGTSSTPPCAPVP